MQDDDVVQIVDNLASEDDVTPRSKEDEKAREPKGECLAILEIKLDALASFFWEQGRCTTRGTAWFIAKN